HGLARRIVIPAVDGDVPLLRDVLSPLRASANSISAGSSGVGSAMGGRPRHGPRAASSKRLAQFVVHRRSEGNKMITMTRGAGYCRSWIGVLLAATSSAAWAADAPKQDAAALEFFEKQVRPVLANRCFSCHGPKQQFSSLRVDSREALLKGG